MLITFDEGDGYFDSGYVQPIDFFGDGPRTVLNVVSPQAKKGHVDHTYAEQAPILKFIEWNWRLKPLSEFRRDNLPIPSQSVARAFMRHTYRSMVRQLATCGRCLISRNPKRSAPKPAPTGRATGAPCWCNHSLEETLS